MPDMLVSLLHLPQAQDLYDSLEQKGIRIQRAMTPDKLYVVKWVKDHFGAGFAGECDASFSHHPVSCFLAVQDRRILGFACYTPPVLTFSDQPPCWNPSGDQALEKLY